MTTDVETTSIVNHRLSDETGRLVVAKAIPAMLDFYDKHNIKSTFFITGYFAERFPEAVRLIHKKGHEIGCHGYSHQPEDAFDKLSLKDQILNLKKAKSILEQIISAEVISFRAPALRTNEYTVKALEETGFQIDSSISSQRFDFFLSLGSKQKLQWLKAPRAAYHTDHDSLAKRGNSSIFEIPISALLLPYIGTTMRIFPNLIKILRYHLTKEAISKDQQINFLIHPIELIEESRSESRIERRSRNFLKYILSDVLRHKLKIRKLGPEALALLEEQIVYFEKKNFEFITCRDYYSKRNR